MVDSRIKSQPILEGRIQTFSMRGLPLLSQGATHEEIVTTEHLWLAAKVYSSGGENALHKHATEDHAFFVLAGAARFFDGDGGVVEIGPLEGIVVPKETLYRFESIPPENLVMLRMGGAKEGAAARANRRTDVGSVPYRQAPDGSLLSELDPRNGTPAIPPVESGEFFGV